MKTMLGNMCKTYVYTVLVEFMDRAGKWHYGSVSKKYQELSVGDLSGVVQNQLDDNILVLNDEYDAFRVARWIGDCCPRMRKIEVWRSVVYKRQDGKNLVEEEKKIETLRLRRMD